MPTLIAYAWLATAVVGVALATWKKLHRPPSASRETYPGQVAAQHQDDADPDPIASAF